MYFEIYVLLVFSSACYALYTEDSFVDTLSNKNFTDLVINSKNMWIVKFYLDWCGECQKFSTDFSRVAQAFDGIVKFGTINGNDNLELVQEHVISGYPCIMVFNGPRGLPQIYTEERDVMTLTSFITVTIHALVNMRLDGVLYPAMFKTKRTEDLNESNFPDLVLRSKKMWLVIIYTHYAPECNKLSEEWNVVEKELDGIIKIGSLDAIANYFTAGQCKLMGYPTIKFFPRGKKKVSFGLTYIGKNTANDIVDWVFSSAGDTNPLPKVVHITNNVALEEACNKKRMCIIAFIPQSSMCVNDCQRHYLNMLEELVFKLKNYFLGWAWTERKTQPKLEEALSIGDVYRCLAAVNLRTNKYALSFDFFTTESVSKFLENVLRDKPNNVVNISIEIENINSEIKENEYLFNEEL